MRLALKRLVTEDVIHGAISGRILLEMFPPVALCCGSLRGFGQDWQRQKYSFGQPSADAGIGPVT